MPNTHPHNAQHPLAHRCSSPITGLSKDCCPVLAKSALALVAKMRWSSLKIIAVMQSLKVECSRWRLRSWTGWKRETIVLNFFVELSSSKLDKTRWVWGWETASWAATTNTREREKERERGQTDRQKGQTYRHTDRQILKIKRIS